MSRAFSASIAVTLLCIFLGSGIGAQSRRCDNGVRMELVPSPAVAGDSLFVRAYGEWGGLGGPVVTGLTVSGTEIRLGLAGVTTGPAVVVTWEETVAVGVLAAGEYELYADLLLDPGGTSERNEVCGPVAAEVVAVDPVPLSDSTLVLFALLLLIGAMRNVSR